MVLKTILTQMEKNSEEKGGNDGRDLNVTSILKDML